MLQLIIDIFLFLVYVSVFLLLITYTWRFWMLYVNTKYQAGLKWVLLEIKLPREINKSPEASELWIRSLLEGGGLGVWYKTKWKGNMPSFASLEIASLEGVIHFYIRIETKLRERVEAAIYSQYPNVEIIEAEDYVNLFSFDRQNAGNIWGCDWVTSKSEKADFEEKDKKRVGKIKYSGDMYPIKTYKDWGLDKDPKEMFKHDPLTYFLETISTANKNEFWCHQILIREARTNKNNWDKVYEIKKAKDPKDNDDKFKDNYEDEKGNSVFTLANLASIEDKKLKNKLSLKEGGKSPDPDEFGNKSLNKEGKENVYAKDKFEWKSIPEQERDSETKEKIKAIQNKMSKPQAIVKMRTIIIGKDAKVNIGGHIATHMSLMKPFNEDGFNTLRPDAPSDPYDFPWQDTMKRRVPWKKQFQVDGYKGRGGMFSLTGGMSDSVNLFLDLNFFKLPTWVRYVYGDIHEVLFHPFTEMSLSGFILNTEELATLYHFPGEVAATPGIPRIDSVKGSATANVTK